MECIGTDKGNNKTSDNLERDRSHDNSNREALLLGSGTCYRFEACDNPGSGGRDDSGGSGRYFDGSGGHYSFESGENSTSASGGDDSSGDDSYFGDITYS